MENPYDARIKRINELSLLWEKIHEYDSEYHIAYFGDSIVIIIDNLEFLSKARELARKVVPGWKDKLKQVWNAYGEHVTISWESLSGPPLNIWLETSIKDFPDELKKENCKFVPVTETCYSYVCKKVQPNVK